MLFSNILNHLNSEYAMIPEKERIGKGIVFISRYVAKEIFEYLRIEKLIDVQYILNFTQIAFKHGEEQDSMLMKHFSLLFLAEFVLNVPNHFYEVIHLIEHHVNSPDWDVRETILFSVLYAVKKIPSRAFKLFSDWVKRENENFRRVVE